MVIQNQPNRAAFDIGATQDLRSQFAKNPREGLQAASQQFETMFLQMVMKSMRDSVPQDGLLNSDSTRFYTTMLDQQLAQNMATSGKGLGFAKLIEQQMGRQLGQSETAAASTETANSAGSPLPMSAPDARHIQHTPVLSHLPTSQDYAAVHTPFSAKTNTASGEVNGTAKDYVNRVWPHAVEASRATGIPPQFLVAHSALESGWGRSEIKRADGSTTFNIFGVKAGKNWSGQTVDATTTEYVNGQAQVSVEKFRAYASYEEAFRDYASVLRNSSRFGSVIGAQDGTEFARRLQQAGYATDPAYADKLVRVINGPTLRQALIG